MTTNVLYNDNDPFVGQWLRNAVAAGRLPSGKVYICDCRQLPTAALASVRTAHLFAGNGGWPLALQMARWPDERPVWTASLPCQPFSEAGFRKGIDDDRHLWPWFRSALAEHRPPVVFGEQVASKLGLRWLASVRHDLESLGYAVGAANLPAAGVAAPHIRQRIYWMAHTDDGGHHGTATSSPDGAQLQKTQHGQFGAERCRIWDVPYRRSVRSPWRYRPLQPGIEPLVDGFPGRLDQVRAYANAIVPPLAAQFIRLAAMWIDAQ